jgi:predicted secreted Zn-dependent protease
MNGHAVTKFALRQKAHEVLTSMLLLALFVATSAGAEPLLETGYRYYPISSPSTRELLANLNRATPIRHNGNPFHAYTESQIRWRFWWQTENRLCSITRVEVRVEVTFTLPRLEASPAAVREVWERWYPELVRHENGHRDNALAAARRIETGIRRLPAQPDCRVLEQRANALGNGLIGELEARDRDYDSRTNYGESQGASIGSYL